MNVFYIARHGETENNRVGRLSGWIDTPLTENGLVPTQAVIRKLQTIRFNEIISSDLGRAFITAYVIANGIGHLKEIVRAPQLREVNYGEAANMKSAEAYKLYPQLDRDTHYTPPGGESLHTMQNRVMAYLTELNNGSDNQTYLIVAHSGVMAAINASYQSVDFGIHNISEAYAHDFVGKFTMTGSTVDSFTAVS